MKKNLSIAIIIVVVSLLGAQWMQISGVEERSSQAFNERVNLAMRQMGHQLLLLKGDSLSTIPPVEELEEDAFQLRFNSCIDYDTLSHLLKDALADFKILDPYRTVVIDCSSENIILGFNSVAVDAGSVACMGRELESDCSVIKVSFEKGAVVYESNFYSQVALGLLVLLLMARLTVFRKKETERVNEAKEKTNEASIEVTAETTIKIGNSKIDLINQTYFSGDFSKEMTFRESKLLAFFGSHPNQLLERERILDEVWGDEGVIVGRSLDVFVSRLRKLLTVDESINIKTIHGVGYKLEVK